MNSMHITTQEKVIQFHPVYNHLNDLKDLKIFMEVHVFAVWDFMSLVKRLQNEIAPTNLPWRPSSYSNRAVRFINEIVLGEESDLDMNQSPISHFELYLKAMNEVGANTENILNFMKNLNFSSLPEPIKNFVQFNLDLSINGSLDEVAHVFFYGREKLVPEMFREILKVTENNNQYSAFNYYLNRHVQLDAEEHGPMAEQLLSEIPIKNPLTLELKVKKALELRRELWDYVIEKQLSSTKVSQSLLS
jgi:hypothetical protein